jgi:DNA-binding FadR family transcriptional regulator
MAALAPVERRRMWRRIAARDPELARQRMFEHLAAVSREAASV